ncbi:hypothetical protein FFK22_005380 [Mycobacterium sp. KBS0706]|jgi:hypothetical protein|uniref:hypothetical protein n=1 Tax=Mycobacterium sp. KBS0706 TaxID=2578109 RepID=UPI00110FB65C|nr:hypothetical protein [Mycobacterium sp. KBS0706]TSD89699.1 hypothetical protein FFK22_005380 [Mycobacterium sp. KBS0706]
MTTPRKPIDEQPKDRKAASRKVDEASAESMDASDPPSFNPGTAGAGEDRRSVKKVKERH